MTQLFEQFTVTQVAVFAMGISIAIKGAWDLIDFFKNKYREKFNKDFDKIKRDELIEEYHKQANAHYEQALKTYSDLNEKINELSNSINEKFDDLNDRIVQLSENDKHNIKDILVKDYHYFVEDRGYIDEFSLDSALLLYKDYKNLGGNSYVDTLMDKMKDLPRRPSLNN